MIVSVMNKVPQNPQETLSKISRRVPYVSANFAQQQNALRVKLRSQVHNDPSSQEKESEGSSFGSAWLPGPLSYPWLLMFAGVPKVIEHLLSKI